jgi:hypothetical protein
MSKILLIALSMVFSMHLFAQKGPVSSFRNLSLEEREDCIEGYSSCPIEKMRTASFYGKKEIAGVLKDSRAHKAFMMAKEAMEEITYFEVEPYYGQAAVGEAYIHFLDIAYIGNKIVGMSLGYILDGCDHVDENGDYAEHGPGYYDSFTEAAQNNCIETDVQWQAHGIFEIFPSRIVAIDVDSYLDWSGY